MVNFKILEYIHDIKDEYIEVAMMGSKKYYISSYNINNYYYDSELKILDIRIVKLIDALAEKIENKKNRIPDNFYGWAYIKGIFYIVSES
jgi:hypothetical protein